MRLRPFTVKQGVPFVQRVHRRLPRVQGALWAVRVVDGPDTIGVALVGHPARELMADTLSVLRVAVIEGHPNVCSMLYGSCSRAARAMGADNLVTYTHEDEHGASLKASGWISDGLTDGGEHSRPSRKRAAAVDPKPKRRWWAPWSVRLKHAIPLPSPPVAVERRPQELGMEEKHDEKTDARGDKWGAQCADLPRRNDGDT